MFSELAVGGRACSVLVLDGGQPVGEAAIRVAAHLGLRVFTTAGSASEAAALLRRLPCLQGRNVLRASSYETELRARTRGRGVDAVLCAARREIAAALRCVATNGVLAILCADHELQAGHIGELV